MSKFTSKTAARKDAQKQGKNVGEIEIVFHEEGNHYTWKLAEVAPVAVTPEPVKADENGKTKVKAKRSNRSRFMPDAIITVLVNANPKRKTGASWARFNLYKNGMSVKEHQDAGGLADDYDWDISHKFISIE